MWVVCDLYFLSVPHNAYCSEAFDDLCYLFPEGPLTMISIRVEAKSDLFKALPYQIHRMTLEWQEIINTKKASTLQDSNYVRHEPQRQLCITDAFMTKCGSPQSKTISENTSRLSEGVLGNQNSNLKTTKNKYMELNNLSILSARKWRCICVYVPVYIYIYI